MFNNLLNSFMMGQLKNHPLMGDFTKLMQGKNPQQQWDTLMNFAQTNGVDINKKQFTREDLRKAGLNLP